MEGRPSIAPPERVRFVDVPNPRRLVVVRNEDTKPTDIPVGCIAWVECWPGADVEAIEAQFGSIAAAVRVVVDGAPDAEVPADAGTPAPTSDVSDVRPVVAELVAELAEDVRGPAGERVERHLSAQGI